MVVSDGHGMCVRVRMRVAVLVYIASMSGTVGEAREDQGLRMDACCTVQAGLGRVQRQQLYRCDMIPE